MAGPAALGLGWASVEHFLPDPGQEPLHPAMMAV
jgi:hypothetical protein